VRKEAIDYGIKMLEDGKDEGEEFVVPLSCWVLLEKAFKDGDTTRWVDGLDAGDVGRYGVEYSTELDSFKEFRYDPARRSVQTNK